MLCIGEIVIDISPTQGVECNQIRLNAEQMAANPKATLRGLSCFY